MEIIEYEPINLYDGRFCKVFHSDLIQLEKPKDVNLAPHFHWHNSFEFNCSISGTLLCEIGSTMAYVKDNDFLFVNPNVIHKSLENSASFLGFAVLVPVAILQLFLTRMIKTPYYRAGCCEQTSKRNHGTSYGYLPIFAIRKTS